LYHTTYTVIIYSMATLTSHHTLPPFPDGLQTAPLASVSLRKLQDGDAAESSSFFRSCKDLGFFYLDMLGCDLGETIVKEAEELNQLQQVFWKLPYEVKDIYGRPHLDPFYAYRYSETSRTDENGVPYRNENYNVSQ
jgi:hypothetical protein